MVVDVLVEGLTDEAVARKLIAYCQHECGTIYGKQGKTYLQRTVAGFNVRATFGNPILMLVDFMDTGLACPPEVAMHWLPGRSPRMLVRVVVRELESWLLADWKGMADFLGISPSLVPVAPEVLSDPKQALVNLARRSRRTIRRKALVPAEGVSAAVGPGYTDAIEEYVRNYWNIDQARDRSPSLDKCVHRLCELQA